MSVAALHVVPFDGVRESQIDSLVGIVVGVIEHRRVHQGAYGALGMSDDQRDEMARAVVANLLAAGFRIEAP